MSAPDCSAGILSQILNGNAIVCNETFQGSLASSEKAQIETVPANASTNYGEGSAPALVADEIANSEIQQAANDTQTISSDISASPTGRTFGADCNGSPGVNLSLVGGPCLSYTLLKEIGIGVILALLAGVLLYGFAIVSPFIPKRGN